MTDPDVSGHRQYNVTRQRLRSSALFLDEIEVVENRGSYGARLSGTRLKNLFFPVFLWLARHTPTWLAILPARMLTGMLRMAYPVKTNPLRQSCEAVCHIAARHGYEHDVREVYRRFLGNLQGALRNYIELYRGGTAAVTHRVDIPHADAERIEQLRQCHGGAILAVPHNLASAFSGFRLNQTWPTLLVARNSSTVARTRIQLAFFERMQVKVLMVRAGNPLALTRALLSALNARQVIAATLDNISSQRNRLEATLFGQTVGLPPWAAKVAAKHAVPIIPVYFASDGQAVRVRFGKPLIDDDPRALVSHYATFFQRAILADPASWAYLGDKRWRRILQQAAKHREH